MEPPPKRLRILQSAEVDEDNPGFIRSQQHGQAVLKNKFERIFAKYENMPESRSDEIDMKTGKLVVDRGHLRRLEKSKRSLDSAQFLNDLISDNVHSYTGGDSDSSDELAPTQAVKKRVPEVGAKDKVEEPTPQVCLRMFYRWL
jgi:hypothetical protein